MEVSERRNPRRVRTKSRLFRYKLRIYCCLHRPVSQRNRLYHYFVILLILMSCIGFNVFGDSYEYSAIAMAIIDSCLTWILTIELILRFWSSDCHNYKGFDGKIRYLKDFGVVRALDLIAVLTFISFVFYQTFDSYIGITLRLLHIFQVLQIYRLIQPLMKIIIITVVDQFHQLYIAYMFATLLLLLISFSFYLRRGPINENVDIFGSFWFGFITLTTIGYGDVIPNKDWIRVLICFLAFFGIGMFQLPANIFGTGLALKMKERQKISLYRNPASNLIQSLWRCYATDSESKLVSVWNQIKSKRQAISDSDKLCIKFVLKFRYLRARHQFISEFNQKKKFVGESEEQLELLRSLTLIESALTQLKSKTSELRIAFDSIHRQLEDILNGFDTD